MSIESDTMHHYADLDRADGRERFRDSCEDEAVEELACDESVVERYINNHGPDMQLFLALLSVDRRDVEAMRRAICALDDDVKDYVRGFEGDALERLLDCKERDAEDAAAEIRGGV